MAATRQLRENDVTMANRYARKEAATLRISNCPGTYGHEGRSGGLTVSADFCDKCIQDAIRDAWLAGRMES